MKLFLSLLISFAATGAALAQSPGSLRSGLDGLNFLVGRWVTQTRGMVADTGGSSAGEINFTSEVGGAVLLRRDHVVLYGRSGEAAGDFNILMMIYPEAGDIHADYADGDHVIHYISSAVVPGKAVTFTSAALPKAPTFKLTYVLKTPSTLDVVFAVAPPGSLEFHPIASGSAVKAP